MHLRLKKISVSYRPINCDSNSPWHLSKPLAYSELQYQGKECQIPGLADKTVIYANLSQQNHLRLRQDLQTTVQGPHLASQNLLLDHSIC